MYAIFFFVELLNYEEKRRHYIFFQKHAFFMVFRKAQDLQLY
jgi:hypothetical protein